MTIPANLANYHFFAAGATGSGKSSLLRILMRSVLPDVKHPEFDTRAIIYDAKTEIYPDLVSLDLLSDRDCIILNPFDARCWAWDIAADVTTESQANELAAVMVPPNTGDGQNRYFYDASRLMLKTAAVSLIALRPNNWSFRDLLNASSNVRDLRILAKLAAIRDVPELKSEMSDKDRAEIAKLRHAAIAPLAPIKDLLSPGREARAVRTTLAVENNAFHMMAAAWHIAATAHPPRKFSLKNWVSAPHQNGLRVPPILLLGASKEARSALATLNRVILQRAQQLLLDYGEANAVTGRRTWLFFDEFPSLGAIPHLEEFLTEGRSRGVCAVLGFQHIAHIRKHYGQLADALLGQCLHQAYFRANDAEMAEWSAKNFGHIVRREFKEQLMEVKSQSPIATASDFLFMEPATPETGFVCWARSAKSVIPDQAAEFSVKARDDLKGTVPGKQNARAFVPWPTDTTLRFLAWTPEEREALGLPSVPKPGEGAAFPANSLNALPPVSTA